MALNVYFYRAAASSWKERTYRWSLLSFTCSRSYRLLCLYSADSLSSGAIASIQVDIAPSTLIPFYDPDNSVVFLTGKVNENKTKSKCHCRQELVRIYNVFPLFSRVILECTCMRSSLRSRTLWTAAVLWLQSRWRYRADLSLLIIFIFVFSTLPVCLLVCLFASKLTDRSNTKHGGMKEPITFWCGSGSGGWSRITYHIFIAYVY